jgi:DNA polymerase (family X)
MDNPDVARTLHEIAVLTELEEGSRASFRARAYHNAVRAVEAQPRPVAELSRDELLAIDGVGKAIADKIRELVDTGTIKRLEELRARYPPGYLDLVRVPGIGPKTVALLYEQLGIASLEDLKTAIGEEQLRDVPGLGERTEQKLARAIDRLGMAGKERRAPIADALPLAERIVGRLRDVDEVRDVAYAGSLRRFRETIADIDIVAAATSTSPVMDAFTRMAVVRDVLARGETKATVLTAGGIQVDLRVVAPEQWGAALVYFTGSKEHNIRLRERAVRRGWTLNEYGLFEVEGGKLLAGTSEEEVYEALGLAWIPPGMREDVGEVEPAEEGRLPALATVDDLRGDLHVHTDLSGDGHQSLEEVLDAVAARGYAYVAITDHAENLPMNAASREDMLAQREQIREVARTRPDLVILHGSELNIGPDGGLDYDRDFLLGFDWCVASVHSHFDFDRERQTARIVSAMEHPAVNAIGHLQGRRIGKRPGIDVDVGAVLDAAERTGTAIEINCHLDRLDATADVLLAARGRDVVFVVDSDAHRLHEFDNVRHGMRQAERGWVPAEQIANTWPVERFLEWAGGKRGRRVPAR